MEETQLIRTRKEGGLEIIPGVFVMRQAKFLTTNLIRMNSKHKIIRDSSRALLEAYMAKTGKQINLPEPPTI